MYDISPVDTNMLELLDQSFLCTLWDEDMNEYGTPIFGVRFRTDFQIEGHGVIPDSPDVKKDRYGLDWSGNYRFTFSAKEFEFDVFLRLNNISLDGIGGTVSTLGWTPMIDTFRCVFKRGTVEDFELFLSIWKLSGYETVSIRE